MDLNYIWKISAFIHMQILKFAWQMTHIRTFRPIYYVKKKIFSEILLFVI